MFGGLQMLRLLQCSDEAFLKIVYACAKYYNPTINIGLSMMFGDGTTDKDILEDRIESIYNIIALMESIY
jgi:hypothetical protein